MTTPGRLVHPFPQPGRHLVNAYRELAIAAGGNEAHLNALGDLNELPRPWIPATCTAPILRSELWVWFDSVVAWLNHELVFDPADVIPACWPHHPHVIHELAVLADLRWQAERSLTADLLEEWHRYALPAFLERLRHRLGGHCSDRHATLWPSAGRFSSHLDDAHVTDRARAFSADVTALRDDADPVVPGTRPRLQVVDSETGELFT